MQQARTTEHDEQCALFQWAALSSGRVPELALLFAIPNGGARDARTGARMKAEGARAGVWDVLLPCARPPFIGLWIEMKVGRNVLTPAQHTWGELMRAQGYRTEVCYDWTAASAALLNYLQG